MFFTDIRQNPELLPKGRSRDLVALNCSRCGIEFRTQRGEVVKAVHRQQQGMYCSRFCAGKGLPAHPVEAVGGKDAEDFSSFRDDPGRLASYGWKDRVLLRCSQCGSLHFKKRDAIWQAIRKKQDGMYCSRRCVGEAVLQRTLVVRDGVPGRVCKVCGEWKPLSKMMSNGKALTCFSCWPKRPQQLFYRYRKGAHKRGISFDLSYQQFLFFWQQSCFYCGDDIETIGLDRVDNSIGYSEANVVPCCYRCNVMKQTDSVEEFVARCQRIAGRHHQDLKMMPN